MLRKFFVFALMTVLTATAVSADVAMVEHRTLKRNLGARTNRDRKPGEKQGQPITRARGSQALIDASGVQFFINTNIASSTSSNASAAMSEASYTHAVVA
ncbi:MAG: hypothetical protein ACREMY_21630, partial [bacterium]